MNKITTTFTDGQILHAADLNPLVTAINQAADELATKANSTTLSNTTRTANNALAAANSAATAASQAQTDASAAQTAAAAAETKAAQASSAAEDAYNETVDIRQTHYKYVRIVTGQNMPYTQGGTDTFDGIAYDVATRKYTFFKSLIPGAPPTLFATATGADEIFTNQLADGTWSSPKQNILFSDGANLYHGYGDRLYHISHTAL